MAQLEKPRGVTAPIVISVIWAVLFVLGAWPAIATVFLFDSGPELQLWGWLVFYGMWSFEALAMLIIPGIWLAWLATRYKSWGGTFLTILAFIPALAIIPVVIAFFVDGS